MDDSIDARSTDLGDNGVLWKYFHKLNERFIEHESRQDVELHGQNGDNGMRGNIRDNQLLAKATVVRLEELEKWGTKIWTVDRFKECIGKALVEKMEAKFEEDIKEMEARIIGKFDAFDATTLELKKSRLTMLGSIAVALITSISAVVTVYLTTKGTP